MSEDKFQNDILNYVTHASLSLKENASEPQTKRDDEEESNPVVAEDALDDSSSSYCTALCSLSEYSEALEDATQTACTDPPSENASSGSSQSVAGSRQTTTNFLPENNELLQDLKIKQPDDKGRSQDVSCKEPLHGQNKVSTKNPVFIESKQCSSSPKITILNVNLININSVDVNHGGNPINIPNSTSRDCCKSKKNAAQTHTKPVQNVGSLDHTMVPNTIQTRSKAKDRNQEHPTSDNKPEEHPTILQQRSRNANYKPSTEFNLDCRVAVISKMKWEGEEQGLGDGKVQAEMSLSTGNRKPPASCTLTLTANKQKSGILPHCYSNRLLVTRNQHQSQSPPVSQRLENRSGQGIKLSAALEPTPCSSSRQHDSSADSTNQKFNMATKVAGVTTEVRGLASLEYTRSSCSETNYLDVFNSTSWSSTQLPSDKDFYDWSKDVLSFEIPLVSANEKNTSACSEASSFECIDVALENDEGVDRNVKTVPKRQIQLKRRDDVASHSNENDIILPTPSRPRDTLQRQHSTPAAFHQDSHGPEAKLGQTEQKQKLQKSLSLDETSSKTKLASCIIKNVLSKRMHNEQNFQSVDVSDQTFCPVKADGTVNTIDYLTSCAKEECTDSNKVKSAAVPFLNCPTSSQSPPLKTDSRTGSAVKEHISVSSKILPKLITKHSFKPLHGGQERTQFQGSGTEIAAYSETEKQKLIPSKEVNQGSGESVSCDLAKGKAWNLSALTNGTVGKQAAVKATPEECVSVQAAQKQHYVKDQPIETQEKPGESPQNSTVSVWLACSRNENTVSNVKSQSSGCNLDKDQENGKGELIAPEQSVNLCIQTRGKRRAIAPVHVVRDVRSLVKNTYNLSFRGPSKAVQGQDDTIASFATAALHPPISKKEDIVKGDNQEEKLYVPKPTPPRSLDTVMDSASFDSTSKERLMMTDSILEPSDKIPHTGFIKVSPIRAAQKNSCGLLKCPEAQDSLTAIGQTNVQCSNTGMKQTNCASMPIQAYKRTSTITSTKEQCADTRNLGCEKSRTCDVYQTEPVTTATLSCQLVGSSDHQNRCNLSNQVCFAEKDGQETPGLPDKSQSLAESPSACILTVAPAPVFPYFYKPNLLGYQAVSPNMGTVSYVQGPVLLQPSFHNQPATASGPVPLIKSLSVEGRLLSQPCTADGYAVPQESSKQMENGDSSQKIPSPDTQPCTAIITPVGAEGLHGGAMSYPEMGGSHNVSNPRHMLLDPETGQCFYVDMPQLPQLPQRKVLFDPETCQYVEVVVSQQTLPSTVMTTACAIPFPSLHIPAMYTPHCLSYVQTHQQVLPQPEP